MEISKADFAALTQELQELRDFKQNFQKQEEERIISEEQLEFSWAGNLGRWVWDYKSGRVIFNPRKVEVLGYTYEEFDPVLESFTSLIHPDDYQATMRNMALHLSGKSPVYETEYRMRCKDGSYRWFYDRGRVSERDREGKPLKIRGIVFDISAEKQRKEELQRANASKDLLFSIIAHDLRTPITNLISFIRIVKDQEHSLERKQLSIMLEQLERLVMDTDSLLENLISWASSQTEAISIIPNCFPLSELVEEACRPLLHNIKEKELQLSPQFSKEFCITADYETVKIIIRNLISNAIKFSPRGGTIKIGTSEPPNEIKISVEDQGPGMDEAMIEQILHEARLRSHVGTEKESGHGLGLQICKTFAEKNGGRLSIESQPGQGSRFFLILPNQQQEL